MLPNVAISRRWARLLSNTACGTVLCLAASGCGQDVYEQRLKETSSLFSHLEVLNEHLSGEWKDNVASVRLPKQFQQVAAPPPAPPGSEGVAVLDPRQPDFVNVELPGLRGAFQANFSVAEPGAADTKSILGYAYVLSNHYLANKPLKQPDPVGSSGEIPLTDTVKPGDFAGHSLQLLAEGLHTTIKPGPTYNDWERETFPRNLAGLFPGPVDKSPFVSVEVRTATMEAIVRDLKMDISAYVLQEGEAQVVLLFVIPSDILPSEQILVRRDHCLETLRLLQPQLGGAAGAAPGSPGPAGTPAPATGGPVAL